MAALQMQHTSNFDVPATEDLMELTSDMDRRLGTDEGIDLDIDITGGNQYDGEDEYMEEDLDEPVAQSLPNEQDIREGSDDGMAEDSYAASIAEQASMVDEDIDDADYTGPDVDEDTIVDTALENVADSNQNLDSQDQTSGTLDLAHAVHTQQTTADGDFTFIAESLPGGQQGISAINYDISGLATQHLSQEQSKQINIRESSGHDQAQHSGDKVLVAAKSEPEQLESNRDTPTLSTAKIVGPADVEEVKYKQPEGNDEPAVSSEEDATAPSTLEEAQIKDHSTAEDDFSSRALHPVIVGYQNNEISLFPLVPQDEEHSETYFLRDECHADEFVRDLLDALRSVLEDSINEHDELMISIDDLGLDISESVPECSTTTLRQLIDIYIHLQLNDGMDPVPPLYIHLTSKLRLSSRLQHLRDGILEGKGLSQFHSAKEAEIEQQYDAEEDPGREPEDDSYPAEFSQTSPIELCEETDGKETQPAEEHSQSDALSLPRPSQASEPRDLNKDDEDPGNDIAEALPDTNKTEEEALNADNDSSKAALTTGEVTAAPSPPLPSEDPQQVLDEPTIDDGDFVDYEDEEDLAHGTSSGSSTLQGDVREVATEQDVSEVPRPTAEFQELQMPPDAQESTTQEDGIRRSLVNGQDINAAADTRSVGPSDTVKEDLEYLNYPNEDNASSSDELLEEGEDYIEDDEDAGNLQKDQLELSDNANMDQDATLSQPKGESISYEVEEPQEQADQDPKDRKPSDGAPLGLDIEEQLPSHPIEDEYDFGPTSPQEEQAALDDLDKNNQPVKGEMKQADATDDHTAKATLEPPILDRAVEHDEHDDDEITYEDENNVESPQEPFHAERDIASSPGSLKRVRSLDEDDGAPEDDLQGELPSREIRFKYYGVLIAFPTGAKRVRSE